MSNSFLITKDFNCGILKIGTIITHNPFDSPIGSIVNNLNEIDDDLACFILGMQKESPGKSYKLNNNNKEAFFLLSN